MQIHGFGQVHTAHTVKPSSKFEQSSQARSTSSQYGPDELSISAEAQQVSATNNSLPVRLDRVAEIREQIKNGTYETSEKLDAALERMLDEIG